MSINQNINLADFLLSLSEITDMASPDIAHHNQRTALIALEIARAAGVSDRLLEYIFISGLLHDIGAITVQEKRALHKFEEGNTALHCVKGKLLLDGISWLDKIPDIIMLHHTSIIESGDTIDNEIVFSAQVLLLADYIERLIDRNKYILHQNDDIVYKVKKLADIEVHHNIIECFVDLSTRERFWLDIMSTRLYPILLNNRNRKVINIDIDGLKQLSETFRHIIDFKSTYTATHSAGVSACAEILSQIYGFNEVDVKQMIIAGNLHDIGKLIIPNSILEKPVILDSKEFSIMKSHTYYTYNVINSIDGLQHIAKWAAYHHEKLDGSGYPFHLKADELDTGSRMMAVADIFTALMEDRPYRSGMEMNDIYRIIKGQTANNKLDSNIVDMLFDNYYKVYEYVSQKQKNARAFYRSRFFEERKMLEIKDVSERMIIN